MWIRTAGNRDLEAIQALLVETWHDTYDTIYGAERVDDITAEWHSLPALRARLTQPQSEFVVADTGDTILGMAFASSKDGRLIELHQLYVHPSAQGRGAGAALLEEIEACFPEANRVRLEVEAENLKAVAFYDHRGFEPVGDTKNCGVEDSGIPAVVYEKRIF
ncbi:MAG: GNAT family N-acetyltransferase [Alphaproteobacteria bacterium]|nr:GNAT family N-acetyltransferase [Alphaproteobacteria bacterium]